MDTLLDFAREASGNGSHACQTSHDGGSAVSIPLLPAIWPMAPTSLPASWVLGPPAPSHQATPRRKPCSVVTRRPQLRLPADDPLNEPAVTAELAKLVGACTDQQTLVSFAEFTEGRAAAIRFLTRLGAGVEAFLQVPNRSPSCLKPSKLPNCATRPSFRAVATDVNAIRQAVEVANQTPGMSLPEEISIRTWSRALRSITLYISTEVAAAPEGGGLPGRLDRYLAWMEAAMGGWCCAASRRWSAGHRVVPRWDLRALAAEALPEARETLKRNLHRSTRGGRRQVAPTRPTY
jgi:hypothetical protein